MASTSDPPGRRARALELLVDGRVLDDRHPGVRDFWVPVLREWAGRGGRGALVHETRRAPDQALVAAGFVPVEIPNGPRSPFGTHAARRLVRKTGARATLSPLYLTLDGARRNLATVYDVIGRTHPRTGFSRLAWEMVMHRTCRRASAIVTPSRAARAEVEAGFPRARGRLAVVPPGAPPTPRPDPALLARHGIAPPYALAIASNRPHKRLRPLAHVWSAAAHDVPLVVVGAGSAALAAPPLVRGLGFVSERLVAALMADARCLVSGSLAEGAGLPVLAALAAGVPVVATRVPALEEIAGEAAFFVDPAALDDLVRIAVTLVQDPTRARDHVASGRERARRFTAANAARELVRLLEP